MNEFILFKTVEITTCYKLISIYYKVHCELRCFVQCHVILGANNNCKLPLNVNRSHTIVFQSSRHLEGNMSFKVIDKFFLAILFLGSWSMIVYIV